MAARWGARIVVLMVEALILAGCASTATPGVTVTPMETSTPTATITPVTETPIPTPTEEPLLVDPADLPTPYVGPLPEGAVARLGQGSIGGGKISPDGKMAAVGTSTGILTYDVASLSLLWSVPTLERASPVWSNNSSKIAAGLEDGTVIVLEAQTGRELLNLPSDDGYVSSLEWTPDDRYLVYATAKGDPVIRDAATGALIHTMVFRENETIPYYTHAFVTGALSPDGAHYLTRLRYQDAGSPDFPASTFAIWDIPSGELNQVIDAHDALPRFFAWAPDSQQIAAETHYADRMPIWDITTGEVTQQLDAFGSDPYWSPDGSKIFAYPYYGHGCSVIDVATEKVLFTFDIDGTFLEWSPDSSRLVYYDASQNKVISIDATSGKVAQTDDQAKYFLRVGSNYPRLAVWDDSAGDFVKTLLVGTPRVSELAWSGDGKTLDVTYRDGAVRWDVSSGRPVMALGASGTMLTRQHAPAGPEPRWERPAQGDLHAAVANTLIQTNELCKRYQDGVRVTDPILLSIHDPELDRLGCPTDEATSPDGQTLAVAFNNFLYGMFTSDLYLGERAAVIGVFDAKSMQRLKILRGHASFVTPLAFSPDGSLLASGSSDGTVILWDMTNLSNP